MLDTDRDQAVRRLAQYRPFADEAQGLDAALRDLLMSAAMVQGGSFDSLAAAQAGVRDLWGIEVEIDEVRGVVAALTAEGRCERGSGGFRLTDEVQAELDEIAEQSRQVESVALSAWEARVRELEPGLDDADMDALCEDLRLWIAKVITRHGVESALILYPENPRAQVLFAELDALGLGFLPERDGCAWRIRDRAFALFVKQPTTEQRAYLAGLLNTSFHMVVLTLDPEAGALMQENIAGHRLYLDTNFLYALLGLSTANEALSAGRLVELPRTLGYELAVTEWTVQELRTSLAASRRHVQRNPLPRRELADLMIASSGGDGFVRGFWIAYRDRGTQPQDFFEYFAQIETHLDEHGIRRVDEGCTAVERNRQAIDDQLVLLERFLHSPKDRKVKEHDVKHRLLVERLRGDGHIRFSNARYFFLTRDSRLPRYAMATLDGDEVAMPFCVSASAWMQVMRAFVPRTEDIDRTMVDMLSSPYVRHRGGPSPGAVEAVVGRVDQFEGATPALASRVLADTALIRTIEQAQPRHRGEVIRNAFVQKAQETEEQLQALEQPRRRCVISAARRRPTPSGSRRSATPSASAAA